MNKLGNLAVAISSATMAGIVLTGGNVTKFDLVVGYALILCAASLLAIIAVPNKGTK